MNNPRSGLVAFVGRPNVGKSSLVNALIGEKISIVSPKAQTTRVNAMGVHVAGEAQLIAVDTPGLHGGHRRKLNRLMNRAARQAASDADLLVLVVEPRWTDEDEALLATLEGREIILAVNKIDRLEDRATLLPLLADLGARGRFREIVPVSAHDGANLERLRALLVAALPEGPWFFDAETVTDQSDRQRIAELIREAALHHLHQEVPHGLAVSIEAFDAEAGRVSAVVWVERASHKGILVGAGGTKIRDIGRSARHGIEKLLGRKVFLELWVRVREGWSDDDRTLRQFGLID